MIRLRACDPNEISFTLDVRYYSPGYIHNVPLHPALWCSLGLPVFCLAKKTLKFGHCRLRMNVPMKRVFRGGTIGNTKETQQQPARPRRRRYRVRLRPVRYLPRQIPPCSEEQEDGRHYHLGKHIGVLRMERPQREQRGGDVGHPALRQQWRQHESILPVHEGRCQDKEGAQVIRERQLLPDAEGQGVAPKCAGVGGYSKQGRTGVLPNMRSMPVGC